MYSTIVEYIPPLPFASSNNDVVVFVFLDRKTRQSTCCKTSPMSLRLGEIITVLSLCLYVLWFAYLFLLPRCAVARVKWERSSSDKYFMGKVTYYTKDGIFETNERVPHYVQLHNDDGPAVIHENGNVSYWQYGKLHRTDGPAIGDTWFVKGHRIRDPLAFQNWYEHRHDCDDLWLDEKPFIKKISGKKHEFPSNFARFLLQNKQTTNQTKIRPR